MPSSISRSWSNWARPAPALRPLAPGAAVEYLRYVLLLLVVLVLVLLLLLLSPSSSRMALRIAAAQAASSKRRCPKTCRTERDLLAQRRRRRPR